jgi:drug/metabolite transporter (DMT)-like permease
VRNNHRVFAIVALAFTTLMWSAPPIFQKYLLDYFSNSTQNFYRYLIGFTVSIPFLVHKLRERNLRLRWHHFTLMLWPSVPNILNQFAGVEALKYVMPGFASLLAKTGILFSFALSYWMFKDERWLFRSGPFLAGFALAFGGSIGLALLKPLGIGSVDFYKGVLWILACGPFWALYSVMIKKTTEELGVNISFSLISLWTSLGFFLPTLLDGEFESLLNAPWQANVTLVVSAILAIGLAHPAYYYAVRKLGVSVCQVVLLSTPIPTIVASAFFFNEILTWQQTVFGTVLLVGAAMACLARKPAAIDPAREISTSRFT